MENEKAITTIDAYIAAADASVQPMLDTLRQWIKEEAPQAKERISWGMPTFDLYGNLIHFAAQKHHIGLYPGSSGVEAFLPQLKGYKTSKGAIQLPLSQPLPQQLIRQIVRYRVEENLREAAEKGKIK